MKHHELRKALNEVRIEITEQTEWMAGTRMGYEQSELASQHLLNLEFEEKRLADLIVDAVEDLELPESAVEDIPKNLTFVVDSQDVQPINDQFGTNFDAYFVLVGDGDYESAWGMYGTTPYLGRTVYKVL